MIEREDYLALARDAEESPSCEGGGLFEVVPAIVERDKLPELPPEVIEGVIRRGGKLLVAGASKSGKSYLMIELAVAVATGTEWIGFACAQGRVLYVNLEIQEPQFMHRVQRVCERVGADPALVPANLMISHQRGKVSDITTLVDRMLAVCKPGEYDLVIVDPAYKVQPGSENDADAITAFCAELDRLAEGLGCTIAYTHHHSKGAQGGKSAADRASGSGVFARDADALIDMTELEWDENVQESRELLRWHGAVPYRMEFVLRDFRSPGAKDIWFRYPIHERDLSGMLEDSSPRRAGGSASWHREHGRRALGEMESALDSFMGDRDEVARKDFVDFVGWDKRTVDKYVGQSTLFEIETGVSSATIRRVGGRG